MHSCACCSKACVRRLHVVLLQGNGKLDKKELGAMLQDLAGGEQPTDEEVSFVLYQADQTDNKIDGYISKYSI